LSNGFGVKKKETTPTPAKKMKGIERVRQGETRARVVIDRKKQRKKKGETLQKSNNRRGKIKKKANSAVKTGRATTRKD